jgi:hypothetical protein
MNEEKIKKIAVVALIFALIGLSQTSATSEVYTADA